MALGRSKKSLVVLFWTIVQVVWIYRKGIAWGDIDQVLMLLYLNFFIIFRSGDIWCDVLAWEGEASPEKEELYHGLILHGDIGLKVGKRRQGSAY